ncbi:uncharacterized protein TM35_000112930 [Trypanosoma theileri]|uniref:Uncharacterized protein n=1 Tax=Trypanosoma theileri TaxID=67003 RepID=A0A1X0NZW8_9TRYP|nr:uncharacterized protein TM35_000112930 [Trypanosoma theileri]ORC89759.1 hypothetical protein TM35_000112930 [Trypanosoma theileri]
MSEEDDCLEFPSFEAFDAEDRPPPPSEEEYPIGCEVELVDIGPARIAQTAELWEPFMDDFFSGGAGGRRAVRVVRHQGDYTFVICDADPEMIVGCTLYRACLSEPKVRFKKYIPHQKMDVSVPTMASEERGKDGDNLFEVYGSVNEDEVVDMEMHLQPGSKNISVTDPLGSNKRSSQRAVTLVESNGRSPGVDTDGKPERTRVDNPGLSRRKYNYAMKKGYEALNNENYTVSVYYYTKALRYATDGGVKVFSNRSVAFLGLHNTEAAFNDATRVIELRPQSILGYVRAGNTLRSMKKYEEARSYYEKALEIEPNSEIIKFLIKSDSVMMLYASKIEHRRVASVTLDRETMNVILLAKKGLVACEMAWTETTNVVALLGGSGIDDNDITGSSKKPLRICGRCHRPLTRIEDFCAGLPELQPSLFTKMYNNPSIVECNGRCGVVYCSETCRTKAWASHHWVECKTNGKWSDAFRRFPTLLKSIVDDHKLSENRRRQSSISASHCGHSTSNPHIVQDAIDIAVSRVLVACRMLACIVSNGRSLVDAVQMYEWMLPHEDKQHRGCFKRHSTNLTEKVISGKILTPVYSVLQECFSKEEQEHLTFTFFLHCYELVRYNSVRVRISLWPHIQQKAESYLALFKMRGFESTTTPPNYSAGESGTAAGGEVVSAESSVAESRVAQLEKMVATPAESVAGYFEYMALFEVFALTFQPPRQSQHQQKKQQGSGVEEEEELPRYNLRVRSTLESAAVIHITVTENVSSGEQLLADRAVNAFIT